MDEKKLLIALINLVAGLAVKITGQKPLLNIDVGNAGQLSASPDITSVLWYPADSPDPCLPATKTPRQT